MGDWEREEITRVAASYPALYQLGSGDRAQRQRAMENHWWATDRVLDATLDGVLPLEVVDALLHDPNGDEWYRSYVAAGPIEDLLEGYPERYAAAVASRCHMDAVWADAMRGVWLSRKTWEHLPDALRSLIPEPKPDGGARQRQKRRKRPSKRQDRRPRHG